MKIFLPFTIKDIGGTATFANKFSDSARKAGLDISDTFSLDFDTLFIIADCSLWYPLIAKILRKKIVQRLDGIYHPATPAGKWYPIYNLKMQVIHNWLADIVIYQSKFSKLSCEKFLGKTRAKHISIIYNGVDISKIPVRENSRPLGNPTKLLTFAKFRRRDQIEPLIESVKFLDSEKFSFDIYGSYTQNLNHLFLDLPSNIRFKGKKSNEDLLQILHQYDIFLFSDQSACPNSVIEAMAAGLPVVAFDRGSVPELIKSGYNGEISEIKEDSDQFINHYPFEANSYQKFSKKIKRMAGEMSSYRDHIHTAVIARFTIQRMIQEYMNTFIKK